jgi:hypothetical protein
MEQTTKVINDKYAPQKKYYRKNKQKICAYARAYYDIRKNILQERAREKYIRNKIIILPNEDNIKNDK